LLRSSVERPSSEAAGKASARVIHCSSLTYLLFEMKLNLCTDEVETADSGPLFQRSAIPDIRYPSPYWWLHQLERSPCLLQVMVAASVRTVALSVAGDGGCIS